MKKRGRGGDDETGKLASECKTACIKKSVYLYSPRYTFHGKTQEASMHDKETIITSAHPDAPQN